MNDLNIFIADIVKQIYNQNKKMSDFILNVMYTFKIEEDKIIDIYEQSMLAQTNDYLVEEVIQVISNLFIDNFTDENKRLLKLCETYTRQENEYPTLIYVEDKIFENGNDVDGFDEKFEDFYIYINDNLDDFIYRTWCFRDYRKQIVDSVLKLPLKQSDKDDINKEISEYGYYDLSESLCDLLADILLKQDFLNRYKILFYVDEHIR